MNNIPLAFRDFLIYLVPGIIYVLGVYPLLPTAQTFFESNEVSATLLLFLLGYVAGMISDALFNNLTIKIMRQFTKLRDPVQELWKQEEDPHSVLGQAILALKNELGDETVENETPNRLIYYCMRRIEASENAAMSNQLSRIIALDNLTKNLMPAFVFNCGVWIYFGYSDHPGYYLLACLCLVSTIGMAFQNVYYRRWLYRVALSSYLALVRTQKIDSGTGLGRK